MQMATIHSTQKGAVSGRVCAWRLDKGPVKVPADLTSCLAPVVASSVRQTPAAEGNSRT